MNFKALWATLGVALFLGLILFWQGTYTVNEGERGVVLVNGKVTGIAEPGFNWKLPFIVQVPVISVRSNAAKYTTAAYSKDQQSANLEVSVSYRIPPDRVEDVYSTYGNEENLLSRVVERKLFDRLKVIFGQFNAQTSIQDRGRLGAEIQAALQDATASEPVIVESIQLENIDYSDAYEASIEQRMLAEVEVQKRQQELAQQKVQAEITVTQAQAEADSNLARATAAAEAVRIQGEAEAAAIRAKGDALRDNPTLIDLTKAERWNGVLPTTMLPGDTVPFIDVGAAQ